MALGQTYPTSALAYSLHPTAKTELAPTVKTGQRGHRPNTLKILSTTVQRGAQSTPLPKEHQRQPPASCRVKMKETQSTIRAPHPSPQKAPRAGNQLCLSMTISQMTKSLLPWKDMRWVGRSDKFCQMVTGSGNRLLAPLCHFKCAYFY
jgi:hypothetical protein